jgi:hypothetical protein
MKLREYSHAREREEFIQLNVRGSLRKKKP